MEPPTTNSPPPTPHPLDETLLDDDPLNELGRSSHVPLNPAETSPPSGPVTRVRLLDP